MSDPGSSNSRTRDFESLYIGANPVPGANGANMAVKGIPSDKIIPQGEFAKPGKEIKKGRCWNFRVILGRYKTATLYTVHKIFYNDGKIENMSMYACGPDGYELDTGTEKDFKVRWKQFQLAMKAPILEEDKIKKNWEK